MQLTSVLNVQLIESFGHQMLTWFNNDKKIGILPMQIAVGCQIAFCHAILNATVL